MAFRFLFALLLTVACTDRGTITAGVWHQCTCSYLTDYDDTAHVDIEVCLPGARATSPLALACAARTAHNHVEQCSCRSGAQPCNVASADSCQTH